MPEITVNASPVARKTFEAASDANFRTGDVVRITRTIPSAMQLLALIESARIERTGGATVMLGTLTLLAQIENDALRDLPGRISRFVGDTDTAPATAIREYYTECAPEEDPVTKEVIVPAALSIGSLLANPDVDVSFNAAGLNRHTAILAQSGAGKSYAVGVLIEELLAKTRARIIIVDPNGDYGNLIRSVGGLLIKARRVRAHRDALYVAASSDPDDYEHAIDACLRGARGVVFDLNCLDPLLWPGVVMPLLTRLWHERDSRVPTIIIIDEAHNFAPESSAADTSTPLSQILRIAAEGRKYGLWLTVASQRPQKLNANLISQCDNLVLMKLSSQNDLEHVAKSFSLAAPDMIELAQGFKKGWALALGRIVRAPTLFRVRRRTTPEGGGDVSLEWARSI